MKLHFEYYNFTLQYIIGCNLSSVKNNSMLLDQSWIAFQTTDHSIYMESFQRSLSPEAVSPDGSQIGF